MNFIENNKAGPEETKNELEKFEQKLEQNPETIKKAAETVDFDTKAGILHLYDSGYTQTDLLRDGMRIIKGIEKTIPETTSKDELHKYELLMQEIRSSGVNFPATSIKDAINTQKKKFIREDMSKPSFHNSVIDAYLGKKFSKESTNKALLRYIKDNLPSEQSIKAINNFFNTGIDKSYKEGGFSNTNLQRAFDEQYTQLVPQDMIPGIEKHEIAFKKQELTKHIIGTIENSLSKYTIEEGYREKYKSTLEGKYKKIIDKSSDEDVRKSYRDVTINAKSAFDKDIKKDVLESMTNYNRDYLYGQMENIPSIDKNFLRHFDTMLDNTTPKTINKFAEALNYPNQNPKILEDIWEKIKERGEFKNSQRFTNGDITNTEIEPSNSKYKYETIIRPRETTKSLNMDLTKQYLNDITSKSKDISQITITIPKNNPLIASQIEEIIPDAIKEKASLVEGAVDGVQFDITETTERPDAISLRLDQLNANIIGNHESIYNLLVQNPDMKKIIDDPTYKIVGGVIEGMASRNPTNYSSIFTEDQSFTKWLNVFNQPVNSADRNITNNPSLAFDRASSFLDFFLSVDGKVDPSSKFDIQYKVDGPNRGELTNQLSDKLQRKPSEQEILDAFKERQNATIDLTLLKKDVKQYSKSIDLDIEEKVASFSMGISSEKPSTGGGGSGTERIRGTSGNGLVNGGKLPKNRVACFSF